MATWDAHIADSKKDRPNLRSVWVHAAQRANTPSNEEDKLKSFRVSECRDVGLSCTYFQIHEPNEHPPASATHHHVPLQIHNRQDDRALVPHS